MDITNKKIPHNFRNKYLKNSASGGFISSSNVQSETGLPFTYDEEGNYIIDRTITFKGNVISTGEVCSYAENSPKYEGTYSPLKHAHSIAEVDNLQNIIDSLSNGTGQKITIIDELNSSDKNSALSANQGRILKELINSKGSVNSWDELLNKPSTFPPSEHAHNDKYYSKVETDNQLSTKSNNGHAHDERYLSLNGGGVVNGDISINKNGETLIRYSSFNIMKTATGWMEDNGSYLYNYPSNTLIAITDNGIPHFQGNTIWHAGNDGSGSGLDADLLDGVEPISLSVSNAEYIRVSTSFDPNNVLVDTLKLKVYDSYNVNGTPTTYGNVLEINGLGNHWKPQLWFDAYKGGSIRYRNRGYNDASYNEWIELAFITSNVASATKLQTPRTIWGQLFDGTNNVDGNATINGNILATGEITAYSDIRLKSDIKELTNRGYLNPVSYIKDGKPSIGFIAQEVQKIYPELVIEESTENKYLSLNYAQLTAVLSTQINELSAEVKHLKRQINELKKYNNGTTIH